MKKYLTFGIISCRDTPHIVSPVMLNRHKNGDVRKVAVNFGITF